MANTGEHLMQLRTVLEKAQQKLSVSWEVMEQDYVLSWVLFGMASVEEIRSNLVFKGGTALKKCYFGDYRFSQDLDFSSLKGAPEGDHLEKLLMKACDYAQKELYNRIPNPVLTCSRYTEKKPHPHGQEAFVIRAQLPWHRTPYVRVMVEVTRNERLVNTPVLKDIIHGYPEDFRCQILTYTIEEIFSEKLLAILQNIKKIHEREWSRSRARDYYDVWRMLHNFRNELNAKTILEALSLKCESKGVSYQSIDSFFDTKALEAVQRDWNQWLSPMISPLPPYEKVIAECQQELKAFLNKSL